MASANPITEVSVSIDLFDHDDDRVAAEALLAWVRRAEDPVTVIVTREDGSENAVTVQPTKEDTSG